MKQLSAVKCFGGTQMQYRHESKVLSTEMNFSVFLPPQSTSHRVPVLYWLSGLTCNDQNFVTKAGAQNHAVKHGVAIVCPDTSPRGEDVPDDPEGAYDFGLGAGFYVNATQAPWNRHYQMYDYVVNELPNLVNSVLPVDSGRAGISGHSMGGHGALTIALRNPGTFRSVSAFAPIVSPANCPWGQKALGRYLGDDRNLWRDYDATELIRESRPHLPMLIDQGDADEFLEDQLKTDLLVKAAADADYKMQLRLQPGYDHSYFFIATFIGEHIAFHAEALQ